MPGKPKFAIEVAPEDMPAAIARQLETVWRTQQAIGDAVRKLCLAEMRGDAEAQRAMRAHIDAIRAGVDAAALKAWAERYPDK